MDLKSQYTRTKNRATSLIRIAKRDFVCIKIVEADGNARKVWDIINKEFFPTTKDTHRITEISGHTLVSYFNSFGTKLYGVLAIKFDLPSIHRQGIPHNEATLFLDLTDNEEVSTCLSSFCNSVAGRDGITAMDFKLISDMVTPHLTNVFNNCLLNGVFPEEFKDAIVVRIHKSGDANEIFWKKTTLYRRLRMLCTLSTMSLIRANMLLPYLLI